MKMDEYISCTDFPCSDAVTDAYTVPPPDINPADFSMILISEAPPLDRGEYFYTPGNPFYLQTTLQAFNAAGFPAHSMKDLLDRGIYITTAIKCGKTGYSVSAKTIDTCSYLLEKELGLFSHLKALLLMGDVAIKAMNYIGKRQTGERVIPPGSTYKIRHNEFFYEGIRVFPSYLQTGKNFLIEKSKRTMVAEDLKAALSLCK
jgi:uracil-DNA glycosylase